MKTRRLSREIGTALILVGCSATSVGPWSVASIDTSGRELTISVQHGECFEVQTPRVTETDDSVTIKVPLKRIANDCPSVLRSSDVVVQLLRPLGERDLIGESNSD